MKKLHLLGLLALTTTCTVHVAEAMWGGSSSREWGTGSDDSTSPRYGSSSLSTFETSVPAFEDDLQKVQGSLVVAHHALGVTTQKTQSFWDRHGPTIIAHKDDVLAFTRRNEYAHSLLVGWLQQKKSYTTLKSCAPGTLPVSLREFFQFTYFEHDLFKPAAETPALAPLFNSLRDLSDIFRDTFPQHFRDMREYSISSFYLSFASPLETQEREVKTSLETLKSLRKQLNSYRSKIEGSRLSRLQQRIADLTKTASHLLELCDPFQPAQPAIASRVVIEEMADEPAGSGSGSNNPLLREISDLNEETLQPQQHRNIQVLVQLLIQKGLTDQLLEHGLVIQSGSQVLPTISSGLFPAHLTPGALQRALTAQLDTPAARGMSTAFPGKTRLEVMGDDYTTNLRAASANAARDLSDQNNPIFQDIASWPEGPMTDGTHRRQARELISLLIQKALTDQLVAHGLATGSGAQAISSLPAAGQFPIAMTGARLRAIFNAQLNTPTARGMSTSDPSKTRLEMMAIDYRAKFGQLAMTSAASTSAAPVMSSRAIMPPPSAAAAASSSASFMSAPSVAPYRPVVAQVQRSSMGVSSIAPSQVPSMTTSVVQRGQPSQPSRADSFASAVSYLNPNR